MTIEKDVEENADFGDRNVGCVWYGAVVPSAEDRAPEPVRRRQAESTAMHRKPMDWTASNLRAPTFVQVNDHPSGKTFGIFARVFSVDLTLTWRSQIE